MPLIAFTVDVEHPDAPTWERVPAHFPTRSAALAAAASTAPGCWAVLRRAGRVIEELRLPTTPATTR